MDAQTKDGDVPSKSYYCDKRALLAIFDDQNVFKVPGAPTALHFIVSVLFFFMTFQGFGKMISMGGKSMNNSHTSMLALSVGIKAYHAFAASCNLKNTL